MSQTLAIIKPDAVGAGKAGKILALGSRVAFLWKGKVVRIEVKQS